jgi:hypothetical protein
MVQMQIANALLHRPQVHSGWYGLILHGGVQDFVPWCERSTVLERRDDSYMEAELEVGFKVFVER